MGDIRIICYDCAKAYEIDTIEINKNKMAPEKLSEVKTEVNCPYCNYILFWMKGKMEYVIEKEFFMIKKELNYNCPSCNSNVKHEAMFTIHDKDIWDNREQCPKCKIILEVECDNSYNVVNVKMVDISKEK